MKHEHPTDSIQFPQTINPSKRLLTIGGIALAVSLVGLFLDADQFFHSYIVSFSFVASFSIGALFLVMVHHITRSHWGVTFRRIPETLMRNILWVAVFFLPVVLGMYNLYHWTHADAVAVDKLLQGKAPYLNTPFFLVRQVLYFGVWGFMAWKLYGNSIRLDQTGDWGIDTLQRKVSAPGIFIFGFTVAFASFDWLMSLDPHWFSTMFGVYYFAMSFQATLAAVVLIALWLRGKGLLTNTIKTPHYNDLGKLMFGFTVFYAYIAFSQFFLIYYANIPEETLWFYHRLEGGWEYVTYGLLLGRFVLPFFVLLPMANKSNLTILKWTAAWIVFIHFVEQFWIVMPNRGILNPEFHHIHFSWMDATLAIALVGIALGLFFRQFSRHGMVAVNDPRYLESLNKH